MASVDKASFIDMLKGGGVQASASKGGVQSSASKAGGRKTKASKVGHGQLMTK